MKDKTWDAILAKPQLDIEKVPTKISLAPDFGTAMGQVVLYTIFALIFWGLSRKEISLLGKHGWIIPAIIFGIAGFCTISRLSKKRTAHIDANEVKVEGEHLYIFKESWCEPISNYKSVSAKIASTNTYSSSGRPGSSTSSGGKVYTIIELTHENPEKCIPIYVFKSDERFNPETLNKFSEFFNLPKENPFPE